MKPPQSNPSLRVPALGGLEGPDPGTERVYHVHEAQDPGEGLGAGVHADLGIAQRSHVVHVGGQGLHTARVLLEDIGAPLIAILLIKRLWMQQCKIL